MQYLKRMLQNLDARARSANMCLKHPMHEFNHCLDTEPMELITGRLKQDFGLPESSPSWRFCSHRH